MDSYLVKVSMSPRIAKLPASDLRVSAARSSRSSTVTNCHFNILITGHGISFNSEGFTSKRCGCSSTCSRAMVFLSNFEVLFTLSPLLLMWQLVLRIIDRPTLAESSASGSNITCVREKVNTTKMPRLYLKLYNFPIFHGIFFSLSADQALFACGGV